MQDEIIDTQVLNEGDVDTQNNNDVDTSGEGRQYSETEKATYARFKKEEAKSKALEAELAKAKGQQNIPDNEWRERMELIARGYKDDSELDFIMKNGGKSALNDEFVKMAIDKRREENSAKEKVAMNVSSKSSIERKYSNDELRSMSASDMEAILEGRKR